MHRACRVTGRVSPRPGHTRSSALLGLFPERLSDLPTAYGAQRHLSRHQQGGQMGAGLGRGRSPGLGIVFEAPVDQLLRPSVLNSGPVHPFRLSFTRCPVSWTRGCWSCSGQGLCQGHCGSWCGAGLSQAQHVFPWWPVRASVPAALWDLVFWLCSLTGPGRRCSASQPLLSVAGSPPLPPALWAQPPALLACPLDSLPSLSPALLWAAHLPSGGAEQQKGWECGRGWGLGRGLRHGIGRSLGRFEQEVAV